VDEEQFSAGLTGSHIVTVGFPLVDDPSTSLLAWTTTPWTLPSNLALCVHPDFTYIKIHDQEKDQNFILHEGLLRTLYKDPKKAKFKKVGQFQGADMKGWRYVPLFEYFTDAVSFLMLPLCCKPNCFWHSSRTRPLEWSLTHM
jgi:isoleucyl-tRNA synthetase